MPIIEIDSIDDPRVSVFGRLTEAQLRNRLCPAEAVFIAESPKVINVALEQGLKPKALLCEKRHIKGDAAAIISANPEMPVYTGEREVLSALTGYTLTRGVLAVFSRGEDRAAADVCRGARRVVVIDGVTDTTNIGTIFRSAAALGADAVLLSPTSCDPLNRRSVRVSMGSVFLVPWTWIGADVNKELKELGFKTVALALTDESVPIDDPELNGAKRLALILGTEGDGLPVETIKGADYTARIPMHHKVDSLNVAAAAAVAIYQLVAR
ncbi:MAG: RNA methyltransferase [Muribaculaceae bacterium]|nr:RNA methyltransferase [Muribaculaceae bacterium]